MEYSEKQDFDEKEAVLSRFAQALEEHLPNFDLSQAMVCDMGGGGGVLGGLLTPLCRKVVVCDVINFHAKYEGMFLRLLKEKFMRQHRDFSLEKFEFHVVDAQELIYRDGLFDVVLSANVLEHVAEPLKALRESVRVVRPGGFVYMTFDPVWTADSGSHFFHFVDEPWAHLLSDTDVFCRRMALAGAPTSAVEDFRYTLNRLPASFYRDQIPAALQHLGVTAFTFHHWSGCVRQEDAHHPNLQAAARRLGCDPEELLIRGFQICIVK